MSGRFDFSSPANLLRVMCGLPFLPHALSKLLPPHPALGFFQTVGFPYPELFMYVAAAAEVVACIGLVLAIQTRWAALLGASVLAVSVGALLKVGSKDMWLWNLGGVEYPVFWCVACLVVAQLYWGTSTSHTKLKSV
jgi:putative oxidoreductase